MKKWIIPIASSLTLAACGGGGDSTSTTAPLTTSNLSGVAVDGYIAGATVCLDLNNNNLCDNGEPSATTASNGSFTLNTTGLEVNGKTLLVVGGTDIDTNTALTIPLTSIVDSSLVKQIITPSTSLVHAYVSTDGMSLALAKQRVATRLGVSSDNIYQDPVLRYDSDAETYARNAALYTYASKNNKSFRNIKSDDDDLYRHFDDDTDDEDVRKRYTDAKTYGPVVNNNNTNSTITTTQPITDSGRLLASNCFQCHGTNGTGGFERISGGEASEIYEYRGKLANSDIMAPHGQGYTDAQLQALIGYLNQVR